MDDRAGLGTLPPNHGRDSMTPGAFHWDNSLHKLFIEHLLCCRPCSRLWNIVVKQTDKSPHSRGSDILVVEMNDNQDKK